MLLLLAVLGGHLLAHALMRELRPPPRWLAETVLSRPAALPQAELPPRPMLASAWVAGAELVPRPPPGRFFETFRIEPPPPAPPPMPMVALIEIAVLLAALLLAAWVAVRWLLLAPISRLAGAARAFGDGMEAPPLPEDGTRECQEVSRLFNRMQIHIRQQWRERDHFVAAVSHDLRTPLARLRLRAENLADGEQKRQFSRDIGEMDDMIRCTLDHLRGAAEAEPTVRLDVAALAGSLAEDWREAGQEATVCGSAAPIRAQALALRRCIGNLVENAIRYGGAAEIQLIDAPQWLEIAVHDRGPGLTEAERDQVLVPFFRLEASSRRHRAGMGLGLSIAPDIARRHGGELRLRNGEAGGLVASLRLPRR